MSSTETDSYSPWAKISASRRRFRRWFVDMPSVLHIGGEPHDCVIRDLSPQSAGVRLREAGEIAVGTEVALDLGSFGSVPAEVRSGDHLNLGILFLHGEGHARELARHLTSLPPARRIARRKTSLRGDLIVGDATYSCVIEDISRIGACVLLDRVTPLAVGDEVIVRGAELVDTHASARWVDGLRIGLMFLEVLPADARIGARAPEPQAAASDEPASGDDDFLPGLKLAIEAHIREQAQRRSQGDPYADWQQLVESLVALERDKLEQLARRFEQEKQYESGRRVRELIETWLATLGEELTSR